MPKIFIMLGVLLLLVLPLRAQDDDAFFPPLPLTESIDVSIDDVGTATFNYPEGWYVYDRESVTIFALLSVSNMPFPEDFGSSEEIHLEPGQVIIDIIIFTRQDLETIFEFTETEFASTPAQLVERFITTVDMPAATSYINHDREMAFVPLPPFNEIDSNDIFAVVVMEDNNVGISVIQALPDTMYRYTSTLREMLGTMEFYPANRTIIEATSEVDNTPHIARHVDDSGGVLTVEIPPGWAETNAEDQLLLANDVTALESVLIEGNTPQLGELMISLSTSLQTFEQSLNSLRNDAALQEAVLSIFTPDETFSDAFRVLQFGQIEAVTLENGQEANLLRGTFIRNGTQFDLALLAVRLPTGTALFAAYGDELTLTLMDDLFAIATTSTYSP